MDLLHEIARLIVLVVHLLSTALACSAPVIAAGLTLFASGRRELAVRLALAKSGWHGLLLGFLAGGLAAGLVVLGPDAAYRAAALRLPAKAYGMLVAEGLFTALLYGGYLAAWNRLTGRPLLQMAIALAASTNLLYHFPTLMVVFRSLGDAPHLLPAPVIDRNAVLELLFLPENLARTLHFWSLTIVVGGAALAWIAEKKSLAEEKQLVQAGGAIVLAGLISLYVSGAWTLLHLSPSDSRSLVGGGFFRSTCFFTALAISLGLAHLWSQIAFRRSGLRLIKGGVHGVVAVTMLMALASRLN